MTESELQDWIKQDEGYDRLPVLDTTGHLTIGHGRNLQNGIHPDEGELMFQNDYKQAVGELEAESWYREQPHNVQCALINMNFNLGIEKLSEFTGMISALRAKDYEKAAQEALNSLWARQVHNRANQIADMIRGKN